MSGLRRRPPPAGTTRPENNRHRAGRGGAPPNQEARGTKETCHLMNSSLAGLEGGAGRQRRWQFRNRIETERPEFAR